MSLQRFCTLLLQILNRPCLFKFPEDSVVDKKVICVLLINGNTDDIFMIQEILRNSKDFNFELNFVFGLEESFVFLENTEADIVVLDLSLSNGQGIQTLKKFQARVSHIPILVLTALNDPVQASEVLSLGAQDYLVKGQMNRHLFTRTILHAIERHKIYREYEKLTRDLIAANARLERLVLLDPLTNLLNRRGLQEALSREMERMQRGDTNLLALILDLDNFKPINDTLGHAVGDVALKEISQKLFESVRPTDYVARIGGDEFIVLMPHTRFAEGMIVAGKIRRAISGLPLPHSFESRFNVTASLGMVSVTPDTALVDELLAKTHHVLYKSKMTGKNRISYDDSIAGSREEDSHFSNILQALKKHEDYSVVRQPIFLLADQSTVGYEFLSRFSIKGLEMPDDFFRACQENNILTLVDRYCLHNCVIAGNQLPEGMMQHLNVFPSTMIDIPARNLTQAFQGHKDVSNYCIEISEQQIIGDPSYLIEPVRLLKKMGIQIAIDDVGFGRSCLESLILLEPDVIKIDKKWVRNIAHNPLFQRSLNKILKVADSLGARLVAEGIETEEDLKTLVSIGVPYGQGFYWGRPE